MVNGRWLCNLSRRVFKELNLSSLSRVISPMNGKAGAVITIMVACLALEAIMKYQVQQLNKIRVTAMAMSIDEEAEKARLCVKVCKYGSWYPYICRSVFDLLLCRVWHPYDLLCGVYALFRLISIARYVLKSLKECCLSRDRVWNIPWTCFKERLTTENPEPAVMLGVSVGGLKWAEWPFVKVHMKWKIISAYLKGLSKYRRMAFFFLKYLFSFQRY